MKRSVMVTYVLLAYGGAAYAQREGVQLYGLIDMGYAYTNNIRTNAATSAGHLSALDSGNMFSSRLGFRGRESLGGGLSTVFVLEAALNADAGTPNATRFFHRSSYVGLSSSTWGEVQFGRQITVTNDFAVYFDPQSPSRFSNTVFDAGYAGRADNAIRYLGKFGEFNVIGQYSFGFNTGAAPTSGEQVQYRIGKEAGWLATYNFGWFRLGTSYDRQNGTTVATQSDTVERFNYGVTMDLGPTKIYAATARLKVQTAAADERETKLSWLGLDWKPMPNVTLTPTFYLNNPDKTSDKSKLFVMRAFYDLSKRTTLYAAAGHLKNDSVSAAAFIGPVLPGASQTSFLVGMFHRF
jgi:predicted porin